MRARASTISSDISPDISFGCRAIRSEAYRVFFRFLLGVSIFVHVGCTSVFFYPTKNEFVDRRKLPLPPEDIEFRSANGSRIHGWYFKASPEKKRGCTLLFFHGNGQNLTSHFYNLYEAPQQGYAYMIFDYQGYGSSEGEPTAEKAVQDGRAALHWVHDRFPSEKIVVFGQSLGGALALKSVLLEKEKVPVTLVVVDSTFASYRSVARSTLARSWLTWLFQPLGWLLVSDKMAPGDETRSLAPIPLIVVHGTKDEIVGFKHGQDLYGRAAEPKEFWEIPNGRHTDFLFRDRRRYADKFFDTLDQYCGS